MFSVLPVNAALVQSYMDTDYHVQADPPFVLRIGEVNLPLAQLYSAQQTNCAAYLTACNPISQIIDGMENGERHAMLMNELKKRSLQLREGWGQDRWGRWPPESGCLVLALDLEAAKALGRRFDQNALVWCGPNVIPELVLLR